jgi:hypothetical protein
MGDQLTVLDTTSETFVLAFELVDAETANLPDRVARALGSEDVQKAIQKALQDFADAKLNATPTTVDVKDAMDLAKSVASSGGKAVADNVVEQIKKTNHFKDLDQSIKRLTAQLGQTPVGVWVDENKKWLYIVGVGAVIGGAAAMYATRKGDEFTKLLLPQLNNQSLSFKALGTLSGKVGLTSLTFTPSERLIEAKTFVEVKWQSIEVRVNFAVTRSDKTVTASVDGHVVVPVTKGVSILGGGAGNTANNTWNLHVGIRVDLSGDLKLNLFAGVGSPNNAPAQPKDLFKEVDGPSDNNGFPRGKFVGLGIIGKF